MRLLHRNWLVKLSSLLLAFALFVWVQKQEATTRREFHARLNIPVPAGQELVEPQVPPQVRILISGPAGRLEAIREEELRPIVRMDSSRPGAPDRLPIFLERTGHALHEDIEASVQPSALTVLTEARIEREVQIVIETDGALPDGWDWTSPPRPETTRVMVSGLKPAVDQVARVVGRLRALNPQEQVAEWVPLEAVDRAGAEIQERVTLDPKQVMVRARLNRTVWSKQVYVQPIFSAPPGSRLRVTVEPKRVTLYGGARALQDVHFIETPELDIPYGQTRFFRELRLEVPPGISGVEPPTVRVTIDQLPTR